MHEDMDGFGDSRKRSESGVTTVVWTDGSCNANGMHGRGGPPPPEPDWLKRLNADLDALDANSRLTPQERADARRAIIGRAYGIR